MSTNVYMGVESAKKTLKQYGIRGMKWGVRRKNPSASVPLSEDASRAREVLSRPAKSASSADIQAALNRMRLEADFNKVQVALIPPSRGQRAANFAKNLVSEIGNEQVSRVAKAGVSIAVENALQDKKVTTKDFAKDVGKRIVPSKKK